MSIRELPSARARSTEPPPHDLQAEESLLGAMLLSSDAAAVGLELLQPGDFYRPSHGHVFAAIRTLHGGGLPVDPVTVADQLRRDQLLEVVGGPPALITMQASAPATSSASGYARIVADHHAGRRLLAAAEQIRELGQSVPEDIGGAVAMAQELLRQIVPAGRGSRPWSTAELLEADRSLRWRARGLLVDPTFGVVGGERKTLKTYVATFVALGIASGRPIFERFEVEQAPVVVYVGEGGRLPYTRRLERIATAMGIEDLSAVPLHSRFEVAPIASSAFRAMLAADLRSIKPGLVVLDPLYAFHGSSTSGASLYEEGELLTGLSGPCGDAGACLQVVTHFNKGGNGRGLDRITMAGAQEWSDSWTLLSHREEPNVAAGEFQLLLEVGSRQWGGAEWDLDLSLGRFDVERGEFDGAITWNLYRHQAGAELADQEASILAAVIAQPRDLNREELAKLAGGKLTSMRKLVDLLEKRGWIKPELTPRTRTDGRSYKAWTYVPTSPPGRDGTFEDGTP